MFHQIGRKFERNFTSRKKKTRAGGEEFDFLWKTYICKNSCLIGQERVRVGGGEPEDPVQAARTPRIRQRRRLPQGHLLNNIVHRRFLNRYYKVLGGGWVKLFSLIHI